MKWWIIVTVENSVLWPTEDTTVDFMGHKLMLRPPTEENTADVRMQHEHPDECMRAFETILRFLSAMSWSKRCPARARLRLECTSPTLRGGKGSSDPILCRGYSPSGLRLPEDPRACLAIALYREARSIRNTSYEFLSYFKIINILYSSGPEQKAWINNAITQITDSKAKERISLLSKEESDIGAYLYKSGRCAVAHASVDPIVDPDNPDDFLRLSADMPIARALAEYLIEHELGVT